MNKQMLIVCLKTKSKNKVLKNYLSFIVYSYFIRNKVMNKQILIKNKENHKSIKNEKINFYKIVRCLLFTAQLATL